MLARNTFHVLSEIGPCALERPKKISVWYWVGVDSSGVVAVALGDGFDWQPIRRMKPNVKRASALVGIATVLIDSRELFVVTSLRDFHFAKFKLRIYFTSHITPRSYSFFNLRTPASSTWFRVVWLAVFIFYGFYIQLVCI